MLATPTPEAPSAIDRVALAPPMSVRTQFATGRIRPTADRDRLTLVQYTIRRRCGSPRDYFAVSKKFAGLILRRIHR
jgi:hypothetical protein